MMKYILAATVLVYIVLIFNIKIKINGQPSDSIFYRIFGAAAFTLIFFVAICLPIYAVSQLF